MKIRRTRFNSNERRLLWLGAAVLVIVLALAVFSERWMFGDLNPNLDGVAFGHIAARTNDARHRASTEMLWYPARVQQTIHLGDAVFAGPASTAHVDLNDGTGVDVRENSMVVFGRRHSDVLPNFARGRFKLHVDGHVAVAVAGRTTTLTAKNTDLVLTVDDAHAPTVRVITGAVRVAAPERAEAREITNGNEVPLADADFAPPEVAAEPKRDVAAAVPRAPSPEPLAVTEVAYAWHLEDLYAVDTDGAWHPRQAPAIVAVDVPLRWANANSERDVEVQIATDEAFTRNNQLLRTREATLHLDHAALGATFWRVRGERFEWSSPSVVRVSAEVAKSAPPGLDEIPCRLMIDGDEVELRARVRTDAHVTRVVSELAPTTDFEPARTRVLVASDANVHFLISDEGVHYLRSRGVNAAGELTAWSTTEKIRVARRAPGPRAPVAPASPVPPVADTADPARAETKVDEPSSPATSPVHETTPPNASYRENHLTAAVMVGEPQSSEQIAAGRPAPTEFGVAVENVTWFGTHGLDVGASGLRFGPGREAGGSRTYEMHAHYEHRWSLGVDAARLRDVQIEALIGGSARGATSDHLYAAHRETVQIGLGFEAPVVDHWSIDARLILGANRGDTREYDGTLGLAYHLDHDYAVTLGYHVNLFETRATSFAPAGTPFREGSTDVRAGLRLSY